MAEQLQSQTNRVLRAKITERTAHVRGKLNRRVDRTNKRVAQLDARMKKLEAVVGQIVGHIDKLESRLSDFMSLVTLSLKNQ